MFDWFKSFLDGHYTYQSDAFIFDKDYQQREEEQNSGFFLNNHYDCDYSDDDY